MKVLVWAPRIRYEQFPGDPAVMARCQLVFCDRGCSEEELLSAGGDAEALFVTPISVVGASLIRRMPKLRLIHSEGVGFDRIDLEAARQRGIYVCNNAGCNAIPVAELAVMMMCMLQRRILQGDRMVRSGLQSRQVQILERDIPPDLACASVGLVGFGHIGQAAAALLRPHGSRVFYAARHSAGPETEARLGVTRLSLEELTAACDIVSLHLPANAQTRHLVNRDFLARMKPGSLLINTGRGALIDDAALCEAIRSGHLGGAGLDCYDPEPAGPDHPLVRLAAEFPDALVLCPHQGGISRSSFRTAHQMLFSDLRKVMDGEKPDHIVNGL
jgi:D-3-phosphoglycerate dehydrogenase